MKSFWSRRLWIVVFGIIFVGLFAARLISSGGLGGTGIGFHLLGDSFAAAQVDLEHKGFQCGELQRSPNHSSVEALACDRISAPLSPPQDRVYRVEMVGSGDKITHVTTRVCGSPSRPCPTSLAATTSAANNQVTPMPIPPAGQPAPSSVTTAFAIFSLVVTAAWFLDWRHYIRFWLGRKPNYQGRRALGFRIFFAVSFLSSLQMAVRSISSHSWTFQDCKYAAFWLLVMIASGAILDAIFRFSMGRPKVVTSEIP